MHGNVLSNGWFGSERVGFYFGPHFFQVVPKVSSPNKFPENEFHTFSCFLNVSYKSIYQYPLINKCPSFKYPKYTCVGH